MRIRSALVAVVACSLSMHALADWIRIGSWNIEKLGQSGEETQAKALADYIHLAGIDILALQEIYDNDGEDATKTNRQLTAVMALMNEATGEQWAYEMFAKMYENQKDRLTAIAWNMGRVEKVGRRLRIDIDRKDTDWYRHPHAVKFSAGSGRTDIVVIPVHMKSDFSGGRIGATPA